MKKIILITILILLNMIVCFSQEVKTESGYIGIKYKLSSDSQYLQINWIFSGYPADIAGIYAGDRIYKIDDKSIGELTDPLSSINGTIGSWVKLTLLRFGRDTFTEVNVPRISSKYSPESIIAGMIYSDMIIFNEKFKAGTLNRDSQYHTYLPRSSEIWNDYSKYHRVPMTFIHDTSKDMFKYRTYDFEYTSVSDPLMEKELFKELGRHLDFRGMKRSQENPDLLILMNFYSDKKEQYVPPQQIISTHIKNTYNWYWGVYSSVPIVESSTKEGYTDVTYLTTLNLKFLDTKEMAGSKVPPVVWSGSISETSKIKKALLKESYNYFSRMMYQFPEVWKQNIESCYLMYYTYTGILFNENDLRIIGDVIPKSPADDSGIQKGDEIISINGFELPSKYNNTRIIDLQKMAFEGPQSGLRYLFIPSGLVFKPYPTDNHILKFVIKRDHKKMTFEVKPLRKVFYAF